MKVLTEILFCTLSYQDTNFLSFWCKNFNLFSYIVMCSCSFSGKVSSHWNKWRTQCKALLQDSCWHGFYKKHDK